MKRKWFRAKKKGNGFGGPLTWEGKVVVSIYAFFLIAAFIWIDQGKSYESDTLSLFLPVFVVATIVLFAVMFLTGERPEWHRPGKKRHHR